MSNQKPFPAIAGSCICNLVRYRLLTSPLYVYACHCIDCQKVTGSAFCLSLTIEQQYIQVLTPTAPVIASRERKVPSAFVQHVECPRCKTELWSNSFVGPTLCDVRVGTLDFPSLMEPDLHIFVNSKLDWIKLPDHAKTTPKDYNPRAYWPKSSLTRLDACIAKFTEMKKRREEAITATGHGMVDSGFRYREDSEDVAGEGEKTPTAIDPGENEIEDDEEFEKRFRETERALQERLEKLSLKLEEMGDEKSKRAGEQVNQSLESDHSR